MHLRKLFVSLRSLGTLVLRRLPDIEVTLTVKLVAR